MQSYIIKGDSNLKLIDRNIGILKQNEVLVKIMYTNICGSDIKNYKFPKKLGIALGHEASGFVIEVGSGVQNFSLGDRVSIFPIIGCFKCRECLNDNHRDCSLKQAIGFDLDGTYSSHLIIDYRALVKIDSTISDIEAANIEPLACSNRLVQELINNNVKKSSNIVIIGDGPMSIGNIILLKIYGFSNIMLIGKYEYRMDIARKLIPKVIHFSEVEKLFNISYPDVIIYSANAPETLANLLRKSNGEVVLSPQVRVPINIENEFKGKIFLSRSFAYKYSDFEDIKNFFKKKLIDNKLLVTEEVEFIELCSFKQLIQQKHKKLKTTIKVSGYE